MKVMCMEKDLIARNHYRRNLDSALIIAAVPSRLTQREDKVKAKRAFILARDDDSLSFST